MTYKFNFPVSSGLWRSHYLVKVTLSLFIYVSHQLSFIFWCMKWTSNPCIYHSITLWGRLLSKKEPWILNCSTVHYLIFPHIRYPHISPLDSFCVMKLRLEHESYDSYNVHFPIYCQSYGYFINDSFYHPELTGGKKKT